MTHSPTPKKNFSRDTTYARALWTEAPRKLALREEPLPPPRAGEVQVRARFSAISLGTERLVFTGKVPESEWQRMRAPFQEGDFPFPVKYGYACVGDVVAGDGLPTGTSVFTLHPHQTRFNLPAEAAHPLPEGVSAERALLAANMETALNGLWDGGASPGDHITVVGGGVVGLLAAWLASRIPATQVTVVDVNPARAEIVRQLGIGFAEPGAAVGEQDLVLHTSGNPAGLDTALALAGQEATVLEMSWYGSAPVTAHLGGGFHSRRLTLKSSQVGQLPPERRARWSYRRRLATALSLLCDPALDVLLSPAIAFDEAPGLLPAIFSGEREALAQVIDYRDAEPQN